MENSDQICIDSLKSTAKGKGFEDIIKSVCDYYFKNNIAYIQKFEHPKIFLKDKNALIYQKKIAVDFAGVVYESGKAIFIECKSTVKGIIPIGNETNGIKKNQIELLYKLASNKVDCFILWWIRSDGRVFKLSPLWVKKLLDEGKKSINILDLTKNNIPVIVPKIVNKVLYYDFLGKIREF